jgi:hypothetical protein
VNLSQYVLEPLRVDDEFVLYRAQHSSQRGLPSVLVLAPASKHPSPATLKKLESKIRALGIDRNRFRARSSKG